MPVFVAIGVYMVSRPEEFIRRGYPLKTAGKSVGSGQVFWTRIFGIAMLAFVTIWCVGAALALVS